MKKIAVVVFVFILSVCTISVALANVSDPIEIQSLSDFRVTSVVPSTDGTFLLSGGLGNPMKSVPVLICLDTNGVTLWSIQSDTPYSNGAVYRDAHSADAKTTLALFPITASEEKYEWVVQCIRGGEVVDQTEPVSNALSLYPTENGFLLFSKPDFSSAQVKKYDDGGNPLWQIDWEEGIMFYGVVTREDVHVAYGSNTIRETVGDNMYDCSPTSVMIAFDDEGKILWRHDSIKPEEFKTAVWTDEGHIVLVGINPGVATEFPDRSQYDNWFITEYDELGQLWRTNYRYSREGKSVSSGEFHAFIPICDGYLVAIHSGKLSEQMLRLDSRGVVQAEWEEPIGDMYTKDAVALAHIDDNHYLVASGMTTPNEQDESYADVPRLTIIKEIILPGTSN